jgi:hypothetical protein
MGRGTVLRHEDELVLRTVEASHSRIRLCPDAEVYHLQVRAVETGNKLLNMSPIHADIDQRPCRAGPGDQAKHLLKKGSELTGGHLANGHRKLAVL